jgi:hypothetical protein
LGRSTHVPHFFFTVIIRYLAPIILGAGIPIHPLHIKIERFGHAIHGDEAGHRFDGASCPRKGITPAPVMGRQIKNFGT